MNLVDINPEMLFPEGATTISDTGLDVTATDLCFDGDIRPLKDVPDSDFMMSMNYLLIAYLI